MMPRDRSSMIIQRVATGFVDLFGMKSTGESPPLVSNELSAVVDATDMYTFGRRQYVQAAGSQNIQSTVGIINLGPTVPAGFCWLVHELWLFVGTSGAGITYKVNVGYFALSQSYVPVSREVDVLALSACWAGHHFERPLILPPGDRLAAMQLSVTGAPSIPTVVAGIVTPLAL